MNYITIIGIVASVITAISMLPQLIKISKERKAEDISVFMLLVLISGLSTWIAYGILKKDLLIAISNCVSVAINLSILALTIRYKYFK